MKIKQTVLILGLATFGLVSFAQDNKPDPVPAIPPPAGTEPAKLEPVEPPKTEPTAPPKVDPADPAKVDPTAPAKPEPVEPAKVEPPQPTKLAPTEPPKAEVPVPQPTPVPAEVAPAVPPGGAAQPATPAGGAPAANPAEAVPLIVIDDVPLTDAIRNLARQSSLNFQFDPRITPLGADGKPTNQPNVSIRFENVTAQEALQAVLDNYNLVLVQDPKSKIARISVKDPKAEDPLFSKTIQLRYSEGTNLITLVKSTLSARSSVLADMRTSQLLVTTTEKEMDGVMNLVNKLDSPTKQVLIEARLLETSHNPSTVKGIDWSGTLAAQQIQYGNNTPDAIPFKPATPAIPPAPGSPPGTLGTPAVPAQDAVFGRNFNGTPRLAWNTASGFYPGVGFLNADGLSVVLSFLNNDADTEVISTPRAVTLDNQMAKLEVTRAFPIFQVTPGSANSPAGAAITYTNLGTILSVTPHIAADKNISLIVIPEVSNIDSKDTETLNGTVNTANIYAIRRINTHVMIPSGNTLVMGGLINDNKTKSYIKVPVLGDLPLIGLAFRKESKSRLKQNLLIFITPTIVEDEAFHATSSGEEFLNTRIAEKPDTEESAWDSGKPHDWSKPVY